MTMIRTSTGGLGTLSMAVLAVLAVGCGTQRPGDDVAAGGPSRSASATPSAPADLPCPGESPASAPPATAHTASPTAPPTDHYAENHGFRVPIPLHGRSRCQGLAAVTRIRHALEPLRERGDFNPESTREALIGLGYRKVQSYGNGPTGVGFLIDADPLCVEGTMSRDSTRADAFAGYPDGTDCQPPSGGH